jgi:AraC-like DNA-binding protein
MDIIWTGDQLLVAGPDTRAHIVRTESARRYLGLRFAPGAAPAVLGIPAVGLRDQRVPLDTVWPSARARRLAERLAESPMPDLVLETLARPPADPVIAAVAALLRDGIAVADIARRIGLSERHLRRRSVDAFGYGPKTLARVLRAQRAVELARTGSPAALVAADAGFSDQPHLIRELKSLTGVGLAELTE